MNDFNPDTPLDQLTNAGPTVNLDGTLTGVYHPDDITQATVDFLAKKQAGEDVSDHPFTKVDQLERGSRVADYPKLEVPATSASAEKSRQEAEALAYAQWVATRGPENMRNTPLKRAGQSDVYGAHHDGFSYIAVCKRDIDSHGQVYETMKNVREYLDRGYEITPDSTPHPAKAKLNLEEYVLLRIPTLHLTRERDRGLAEVMLAQEGDLNKGTNTADVQQVLEGLKLMDPDEAEQLTAQNNVFDESDFAPLTAEEITAQMALNQ